MTSSAGPDPAATSGPVVVGVDGSPAAGRALLAAAEQARLRGVALHIVGSYDLSPQLYGYAGGYDLQPIEDALRTATEELVAASAAQVHDLAPEVETSVVRGRAGLALLDASKDAALLVVGARGVSALHRMMMGSTSTEVVHGAHLPVLVVPSPVDD